MTLCRMKLKVLWQRALRRDPADAAEGSKIVVSPECRNVCTVVNPSTELCTNTPRVVNWTLDEARGTKEGIHSNTYKMRDPAREALIHQLSGQSPWTCIQPGSLLSHWWQPSQLKRSSLLCKIKQSSYHFVVRDHSPVSSNFKTGSPLVAIVAIFFYDSILLLGSEVGKRWASCRHLYTYRLLSRRWNIYTGNMNQSADFLRTRLTGVARPPWGITSIIYLSSKLGGVAYFL